MNKNKKVCHITVVHQLYDTRIFHKQCIHLIKLGYQVFLISPADSDHERNGCKIISIPRHANRLKRLSIGVIQAYFRAKKIDADIYHFHDVELIFVGMLLRVQGKKVLYDVHEDMPEAILSPGRDYLPAVIRKIVSHLIALTESICARYLSACIAATKSIENRFRRYNLNVATINNYPILTPLRDLKPYSTRQNSVGYIGAIGLERGLLEMVQSMAQVPKDLNTSLELVGDIPNTLKSKIPGWVGADKVHQHGYLNKSEILDILNSIRVGLVLIHPEPRYIVSQPVKLFEYMGAGIPVIASDFPLWREIIAGNKCGILVNPLDPSEIAAAITFLLINPREAESMGKRGRQAVEMKYNWNTEAKKLGDLYQKLLN